MAQDSANKGSNSLFGGLKKLLFKDEFVAPGPPVNDTTQPERTVPVAPQQNVPVKSFDAPATSGTVDEQMKAKVYQMLESINQPGVDFLEVWNAAEENGGPTAQTVKMAYNTLKYADKSLTKEKLLSSGAYYIGELQKTIEADIQKKNAQRQHLEEEKSGKRQTLSTAVQDIERQIAELQKTLTARQNELSGLDATYEPKIQELQTKIATGKTAIYSMIQQMQSMLNIVEKEL